MSKPGRKRPPKGSVKGGSLVAKDDQATHRQRVDRADLLARMRAKVRGTPRGTDEQTGQAFTAETMDG